MKKLFFTAFFALGLIVSMQAQNMNVQGGNNTGDNWSLFVVDAVGGNAPFTTIPTGLFGPQTILNVQFPVTFIATNTVTGCNTGVVTISALNGTFSICGGHTVRYSLQGGTDATTPYVLNFKFY